MKDIALGRPARQTLTRLGVNPLGGKAASAVVSRELRNKLAESFAGAALSAVTDFVDQEQCR